ncbi:hypothetical protein CRUP_031806, partial [Coryphaenoides rupestris]
MQHPARCPRAPYTQHPAPCTQHPAPCTQHPAPSTLHPAPCTLHPAPCTQHPAPSTQHPAPCTLHPAPCTLHPAPSTLHPAPSTLHPAPSTQHPAPCTQHPAHCTQRAAPSWFSLKDVPSGSVHLRLEWLSLLSSAARLSEVSLMLDSVIQRNHNLTSKTSDPPSAAILAVYLDQADALPYIPAGAMVIATGKKLTKAMVSTEIVMMVLSIVLFIDAIVVVGFAVAALCSSKKLKKGSKLPSPMVQVSVQDCTRESRTCYGTNSPVWEDAFTFFIPDPRKQDIDIQVKDEDGALLLGSLSLPLGRLLESPGLTLDQWFHLENSGSASRIYIKTMLRVLWLNEEAAVASPSSSHAAPGPGLASETGPPPPGASARPQSAWPQNTAPDPEFATEGVLRVHLLEAQHLIAKDNFMGGIVKGKSDPYVKMRVAGVTFRSHTIKENLNPVWNELYEVVLSQLPGQEVQFELFDKDIDQDDFLGRFKLNLRDIVSTKLIDTWYTLNDVKSGRVHLLLEWLPTLSDTSRLEQILQYQSQQSYQNKVIPSAAVLFVYMERAHGLPDLALRQSSLQVDPAVQDQVWLTQQLSQGDHHETKTHTPAICERSTSPRWDESCHFLVRDPREEVLTVK